MAKTKRVSRRRRIASFGPINGLVNSFVKTIFNIWFLIATLVSVYVFSTSDSLKFITDVLQKTKLLAKLGSWMASNHAKASGVVYMLMLSFLVVPNRFSLLCAFFSIVSIYILTAPTSFAEYLGLGVLFAWFFRTASSRIRFAIIALFFILYAIQWWGTVLFNF